jgi:hypothetical protein
VVFFSFEPVLNHERPPDGFTSDTKSRLVALQFRIVAGDREGLKK